MRIVKCGTALILMGAATLPTSAQQEAQLGRWECPSDPIDSDDLNMPHAILLKNKKLLIFSWNRYRLFDTESGTMGSSSLFPLGHAMFCSGNASAADGSIVIVGGGGPSGVANVSLYDPDTQAFSGMPSLPLIASCPDSNNPCPDGTENNTRYYPTVTTLKDGRLLVTSGRNVENADAPEGEDVPLILDVKTQTWTILNSAFRTLHWYPFVFQLGSGAVFMGGGYYFRLDDPNNQSSDPTIHLDTYSMDPFATSPTWSFVAGATTQNQLRPGGSACMYRPDKVMKGGAGHWLAHTGHDNQYGVSDVWTIDLGAPTPAWIKIASMNKARRNLYLIPCPDGRVMSFGGFDAGLNPVYEAEWINMNDSSPAWTLLRATNEFGLAGCDGPVPPLTFDLYRREYHSAAVLMPDGRIFTCGGEYDVTGVGTLRNSTYQIFRPPYLYRADNGYIELTGDRPKIDDSLTSGAMFYNLPYTIYLDETTPFVNEITQVNLVRLGAATHSFDQNTRFIPLTFTKHAAENYLVADAPANGKIAPPGYYMLFVLRAGDRAGIDWPSKAKMVRVRPVSGLP